MNEQLREELEGGEKAIEQLQEQFEEAIGQMQHGRQRAITDFATHRVRVEQDFNDSRADAIAALQSLRSVTAGLQ